MQSTDWNYLTIATAGEAGVRSYAPAAESFTTDGAALPYLVDFQRDALKTSLFAAQWTQL
jgi:hypothetical protein